MNATELVNRALQAVGGNRSELARRVGRSEPTVTHWVSGRNGPDYESALRLARLLNIDPIVALQAVGLDAALLPDAPADLNETERDVLARARRMQALINATDGVPSGFARAYFAKMLDRIESEIADTLDMQRTTPDHRRSSRRLG